LPDEKIKMTPFSALFLRDQHDLVAFGSAASPVEERAGHQRDDDDPREKRPGRDGSP
jgi:hypothetical protein